MTLRYLRRQLALFGLMLLAMVALVALSPTVANAATVDQDSVPAVVAIAFAPNWIQVVTFLVTVALPLLVGLVTTRVTAPGRKAIYLAALAAVTGLGSELLSALTTATTYDLAAGLFLALTSFVLAVGLHFGLYKPTGAAAALQDVGGRHRSDD